MDEWIDFKLNKISVQISTLISWREAVLKGLDSVSCIIRYQLLKFIASVISGWTDLIFILLEKGGKWYHY